MTRRDRRHSGGFLLRIMPPSWHPVPACTPRLRCRRAILLCRYEIRIGRGDLCRYDRSRRNHSSLPQPRLESGAGRCRGRDRCHSGGFLLRIMPPSWQPVPACTRNDHSAGGLFFAAATTAAGGTAILCDEENWNRTRHRCGKYCCRRAILLAGTMALQ